MIIIQHLSLMNWTHIFSFVTQYVLIVLSFVAFRLFLAHRRTYLLHYVTMQ